MKVTSDQKITGGQKVTGALLLRNKKKVASKTFWL